MKIFNKLIHLIKKPAIRLVGTIILTILVIWYVFSSFAQASAWKAIFLDNGQVYFGKGWWLPFSSTMSLTHVHYLRTQPSASGTSSTPDAVIVSLKDDPYGPQALMEVNKTHIQYIEYLRSDSALTVALIKSDAAPSASTASK